MPLLWSWNVLELTATVLVTNRKGSDGRRTLKNQGKYPRPIDFYDSTPDLLSTLYFNVFGTRDRRFSTRSRYPFRLAHLEPHLHSFLRWHEAYIRRTWSISSAFLKQTYNTQVACNDCNHRFGLDYFCNSNINKETWNLSPSSCPWRPMAQSII